MCTLERYTERRGRSAVPATLRLTRLRRFSLCIRFCSVAIDSSWSFRLAGLADLAPDLLVAVADALALVRLGRTDHPYLRRRLAHPLLVYPAHDDGRGVGDLELYPLPRRDRDRVGVADLQVDVLPLQICPVADARDDQRLREPVRHAGDGVLDQGPREPVHRLMLGRVGGALDYYGAVLLPDLDPAPNGHREVALRAGHLHAAARELHADRARDLDGGFTYPLHLF